MTKPRSIFWRYFGVFAAAAFLPIAAMVIQGYHCARMAILDDRLHLMRQLSLVKRDELEAGLRERTRAVGILADLPALKEATSRAIAVGGSETLATSASPPSISQTPTEGRPADLQALLEGAGRKWIAFDAAAIFDLSGKVLVSAGEEIEDLWDGDVAALVRASIKTGLPVPGRVRAAPPGKPLLHATAPILGANGDPIAVLVSRIDLTDTVASILGKDEGDDEGRIRTYILGTDGVPLSSVPGGDVGIRAILAEPPTRFNHEGCSSCTVGKCHYGEYTAPDGVRVIGACYPSSDRKWMVVSESLVSDPGIDASLKPFIFGSLVPFMPGSLGTSAVGLAAMLLAGGFLGRRISSPIRNVSETARRIAGGDLSTRAVYGKRDEVGALVSSFNALVDGLISSREEVRARNRELEDALAQLSRVQDRLVQVEAISAVGRATASVVHEIRNPLSSVKMNLQILSRPVAGDPKLSEHARIARDQVDRLDKMLTDLLDYGRPLHLAIERTEIGRCVEQALSDMKARAGEKGVELTADAGGGIAVDVDPARITQALVNLLANAIDASPSGSRVEVGCSEAVKDGIRFLTCEVRDHGAGILPEHGEQIFDPFFTTKDGGTGLGLATGKKIVSLHGGRIAVDVDPARITQALVNLLANAIDASPSGSRVEVGCSEAVKDGIRFVTCEVRDHGAGILPEHGEEIFDPFFTTKDGGTGLGLATVKKIVSLHGGRIEVESEVGSGTVMRVVLPAEKEP